MASKLSLSTAPRGHVPALDGIRGVAIAAVMLLHFVGPAAPTTLFERVLVKATSYGVWGVDLFFVLSGFLITGILDDARGKPSYFKNFYMRRTLRIFPLYYGVLSVILFVSWFAAGSFAPLAELRSVQGWLWPYLTNVYLAREGSFSIPYISHFWSLAVEEHFYLVWPLVVGLLSRKAALRAALGLSLLSILLRIGFSLTTKNEMWALVFTLSRLDTLCVGGAFALCLREDRTRAWLNQHWGHLLYGSAGAVLGCSLFHAASSGVAAWLVLPLRGAALAVLFGMVITLASDVNAKAVLRAPLQARALMLLGKYSYGLYVFHGIVAYELHRQGVLEAWSARFGSFWAILLSTGIGSALSLLFAVVSYHGFEAPFLRLKRYFEHQPARDPSPHPASVPLRTEGPPRGF